MSLSAEKLKKVDIHVHLALKKTPEFSAMTANDRLAFNNYFNIEKCIILPVSSIANRGGGVENEDAKEICSEHNGRFFRLCNPNLTDKQSTTELLHRAKREGARGVGELMTRKRFCDEQIEHLLCCCEELALPVLFHMAPEDKAPYYGVVDDVLLPGLEKALKKHPNVVFIGHSQPFWFELTNNDTNASAEQRNSFPFGKVKEGRLLVLLREYGNLHLDISANSGANALMRDPEYAIKFINEFQNRMMFGTDSIAENNVNPLGPWLDFLMSTRKITNEVYSKIVYDNAVNLFNLNYN